MQDELIIVSVRKWLECFVVALNLCPFANRELVSNRIRFTVTDVTTEEELLIALQAEVELLNNEETIETTLLIHPNVLQNFYNYNEFLNIVDSLLIEMKLEGVYQVASFHPAYQFNGTEPDDLENYTNRSPYPMLHILREDSLERAIANHPDIDQIPERNIELMNTLGQSKLNALIQACHIK